MKDEVRTALGPPENARRPPFRPPVNGGIEERNRAIRRRWRELRDGKVRPREAIVVLVEEFHLSDKRIDEIVYEMERRRGVPKK